MLGHIWVDVLHKVILVDNIVITGYINWYINCFKVRYIVCFDDIPRVYFMDAIYVSYIRLFDVFMI